MSDDKKTVKKVGRWYFGGLASAGAACCTHPLDLLKVHLQTQQSGKVGLLRMGITVVKTDGILGLYNGLSASILRQLTYSLTRFGIYETVKKELTKGDAVMPFYQKVLAGGVAGAMGGFVGTPADLVNVRMQNDVKLPAAERRNYKNGLDGLYRVFRNEGPAKMFSGATLASSRAVLVTIGQLSFYDQFKQMLLKSGYFQDNITTHFTASFMAGAVATLITMPLDVMKTRMMNAPPGMYSGILAVGKDIAITGPTGFFKDVMNTNTFIGAAMASHIPRAHKGHGFRYVQADNKCYLKAGAATCLEFKGFVPAFVRLGPHTIITFIFFEQIRLRFGTTVVEEK